MKKRSYAGLTNELEEERKEHDRTTDFLGIKSNVSEYLESVGVQVSMEVVGDIARAIEAGNTDFLFKRIEEVESK